MKKHSATDRAIEMHHIMFDIDGTLVQSNDFDTKCFIEAVKDSAGLTVGNNWSKYKHVTDFGILDEIITSYGLAEQKQKIHASVKEVFVDKVHRHLQKNPIYEITGASSFLSQLRKNNKAIISIATGGWYESAILKLQYANIDFQGIPIVSSNDHFSRTEIMKLAANKIADNGKHTITYFGDALWDKNACMALGYNFIAVGGGVKHYQTIQDFSFTDKAMKYIGI